MVELNEIVAHLNVDVAKLPCPTIPFPHEADTGWVEQLLPLPFPNVDRQDVFATLATAPSPGTRVAQLDFPK